MCKVFLVSDSAESASVALDGNILKSQYLNIKLINLPLMVDESPKPDQDSIRMRAMFENNQIMNRET